MNPYKLSQIYKQLTSQNSILKKYLKLGTKDLKQPDLPAFVETKNAVNRFMRDNPRPDQIDRKDMAGGGMLVQPSADGSRPGYAGTPVSKEKLNETKKLIKEWEKTLTDAIKKKGSLSKTVGFYTFLNNKFKDEVRAKSIQARALNNLNYRSKDRYSEIQENFARSLIEEHNKADKLLYKRGEIFNKTRIDKNSALGQSLLETMNDPKIGLDDIDKKINKAFDKIVNGEVILKKTKNVGVLSKYSLVPQMIGEISGVRNIESITRALQANPKFKDKNFVQVFTYLNRSGLAKDFIGSSFDEVFEYAKYRQGGLEVKGLLSYTTRYQNPESNILNFAVRHANRHFRDGTSEQSLVKFYKKRANGTKGAPINFENLPRDRDGNRILDLNKVGFEYEGQFFHKENLKTKGFKSGLFQEVYDLSGKNRLKVPDPNNPSKKITLQQLLKMTGDKLTIGHDEATGGVKGNPFNNLQLQGNKLNTALFNAYDKIQNKQLRKLILNELQLVVPKGVDYETAFINKSIEDAKNIVNTTSDTLYRKSGKNVIANLSEDFFLKSEPFKKEAMRVAGIPDENEVKKFLASMGKGSCAVEFGAKGNKDGGRIGYKVGTKGLDQCAEEGALLINSGMKNANSTQLKNFAAFANRAKNLGRNIMKFGVIPEAMYVAADATIRLTMGDKPTEALLRASEYLLPGDQTKLAEMMEATRLSSPETAAIIGRSLDYKNQLAKIQSLEDTRANLENLSGGGEFDYIGDLNNDVRNLDNQIKQATDALNTKFKMTDAEQTYADAMQAEVDDRRKSKSILTKLKSIAQGMGDREYGDVETLGVPEKTQEQLNQRLAPQLPRDLLLAPESELIGYAKYQRSQGFDIPDDYYIQQQQDVKNMSLAELAAATSPEQVYGFQGHMGEPLNKGVVEKPQNVIGDMEREITGQTNVNEQGQVINPFDIDLSMIGTGLRGFSAAGGGIAKQAGVDSGPPPESGPSPQGLSYLMKRGKNI